MEDKFRMIEKALYDHYKNIQEIERMKSKVQHLSKQKCIVLKEMKELKGLNLSAYNNMGIDYSRDKIQTSSSGTTEAEAETIRYITALEKEIKHIDRNVFKVKQKIREFENKVYDMEFNINTLNEEYRKFVELKYKNELSVSDISERMYQGVRSTANKRRKSIIENIGHWMSIKSWR